MFVGTQVDIMFFKKADSVCCLLSCVFFLCFYYAEAGMPRSRAAQCAAGPRPAPFRCPPYRGRAWIIVKKVDKYAIIKDTKRRSKNVNKEKSQYTNEFKQTIVNLYYTQTTTDYRAPMNITFLLSAGF